MELRSSADIKSFKTRELQSLLVLVLSLGFAFNALASSQGISFQTFNNSIIRCQGNATIDSNNFIQITPNSPNSTGWATYHEPMRLWDKATSNVADFNTQFTFVIDLEGKPNFVDGFTFFLAPNGSQLPNNSVGGALGIVNAFDPQSARFVAIEFDTFYTEVGGQFGGAINDKKCSQPPLIGKDSHIGIDLNNLTSVNSTCVDWLQDKIISGGQIKAVITYNSNTQNLSVLIMDADATGTSINSANTHYKVNFTELLPEWVTFGFSASTGACSELHSIVAWEFGSTVQVAGQKSKSWLWPILGSSSFLLLIFFLAFIWFRHRSKSKRADMSGEEDDLVIDEEFDQVSGPKKFTYKELVIATDNFTVERLLGEGGFGRVYEGYLTNVNANVAIKKINPGSRQGIKEFATEVMTISQLRHRNLVQLIGWCHEKKELILVYEFMSNGSLDSHLFKERSFLPWENRYKIVQGIASALLYLHEEWEQCIIHRDIKSSNIMLDYDFNAKIGDFGLARLVDHTKGLQTTVLAGTMGYMAPECVYTNKASKESDVYSFGVVLLEITCGREVIKPRAEEGQVRLVDWVWELYGTKRLLDAADPKLGIDFDGRQLECLMVVGLWCAHPDYTARPSIREASNVLNFNTSAPVLPSKLPVPTYPGPLSTFSTVSIPLSHATSTSAIECSTFTTSSVSNLASPALLRNTV
ncbi:hypothetical protein EUGRSUZ_D00446 [Eucalyptus grandis]|uniref:Uncharacterized protein n=2 Tax=Eucalyptus grandis TaxID=71139 RepID=A0ACC3L389_EUCGR|nr:hypothetical protein EUGRSUZ_D00446 [Eucalyptus grandis]